MNYHDFDLLFGCTLYSTIGSASSEILYSAEFVKTAEIDYSFFLLDTCHSWHVDGRDVTVCFDLPKGKSTLEV